MIPFIKPLWQNRPKLPQCHLSRRFRRLAQL